MRSLPRTLACWLVLPSVVGGFTYFTWWLMQRGIDAFPAYGVATTSCFIVLVLLERVLPYRPEWNRPDGQLFHDFGHTLIGTALGSHLGRVANDFAFGALAVVIAERWGGSLWSLGPASLPFLAQFALVALIADFGRHVQHRLHHRVPLLWRFHALHHDVDKLSTIKNARSHAVERVLQAIAMFGPLVALGAPAEVVFWYMATNSFLGQLDHSNVDARIGVLELVINGPASHRIHHGKAQSEGNANFGSALVIWDMLLGTWRNPLRHEVGETGVFEPEPRGFVQQLVSPFLPRRTR